MFQLAILKSDTWADRTGAVNPTPRMISSRVLTLRLLWMIVALPHPPGHNVGHTVHALPRSLCIQT